MSVLPTLGWNECNELASARMLYFWGVFSRASRDSGSGDGSDADGRL